MPSEVIDALERCSSLRHVWYQLSDRELRAEEVDKLMEVQHAVPRVRWHLSGEPNDSFDETRRHCSRDSTGRAIQLAR